MMKRFVSVTMAMLALLGRPPAAGAQAPRGTSWRIEANSTTMTARNVLYEERFADAAALAEQALAARDGALGPLRGRVLDQAEGHFDRHDYARNLEILGEALLRAGRHARAEQVLSQALALREAAAPGSRAARAEDLAVPLALLGELHRLRGDAAKAEVLLRRALALLGDDWLSHEAGCLAKLELSRLLAARGEVPRALAEMEPLLSSRSPRALRWSSPAFARAAALAGALKAAAGDRGAGLAALEEASVRLRKENGVRLALAEALTYLGDLDLSFGDAAGAEASLEEALSLQERLLGDKHPALAGALDGLARVHLARGDARGAAPLLDRATGLLEASLGPEHPELAPVLDHLADLHVLTGDLPAAERTLARVLALRERAFGSEHLGLADSLERLAELRLRAGDAGAASALAERAERRIEAAFGPEHPRAADLLDLLARIRFVQGDSEEAGETLSKSLDVRDRELARLFASVSEPRKRGAALALQGQTDLAITFHLGALPASEGAARRALTASLRRKGLVLDAAVDGRMALRGRDDPDDTLLLDQIVSLQSQIVALLLRGPGKVPPEEHRAAIRELSRQRQALEVEMSRRAESRRVQDRVLSISQVEEAIPAGAALVEIVRYRPVQIAPRAPSAVAEAPRYAAYLLLPGGRLASVDLGAAAAIDSLVRDARRVLASPGGDPRPALRALDETVTRPLRARLGGVRWLLVSPDGDLGLIPWGALVDEENHHLLEHSSFTYLTSGRDVLRYLERDAPSEPGPPAVIVGEPDFGPLGQARRRFRDPEDEPAPGPRSAALRGLKFSPLPGTAAEAKAIGARLPGATVLLGGAATEQALKAVRHPRILHLATHGFFLPDQPSWSPQAGEPTALENPLLRAGVALAGANRLRSGDEDAILTALEATGLDLFGTRLVVLSACDTGVGEVRTGEGIYGLRRGLAIAGAETLVMSLWKVDDASTRDLMISYYEKLAAGGGRTESLRLSALEMLATPARAHPFYWAAFIVAGNGATLAGVQQGPTPRVATGAPPGLPPGRGGCACAAVGERRGGQGLSALAAVAALAALAARRRAR